VYTHVLLTVSAVSNASHTAKKHNEVMLRSSTLIFKQCEGG